MTPGAEKASFLVSLSRPGCNVRLSRYERGKAGGYKAMMRVYSTGIASSGHDEIDESPQAAARRLSLRLPDDIPTAAVEMVTILDDALTAVDA